MDDLMAHGRLSRRRTVGVVAALLPALMGCSMLKSVAPQILSPQTLAEAENLAAGAKAVAAAVAAVIPSSNATVQRIQAYAGDAVDLFGQIKANGAFSLTSLAADAEAIVSLAESFSPSPADTLILTALKIAIMVATGTFAAARLPSSPISPHAAGLSMSVAQADALLSALPRP